MIQAGDMAPDAECEDHNGQSCKLSDFWTKGVTVLYFYPKDSTGTCTKQACDFQENLRAFHQLNCQVVGISPDDAASHRRFREAQSLAFVLLCDHEHRIAETYGVWREKSLYGHKYMGVIRSTFVIDPTGRVLAAFDAVRLKGHIDALLKVVDPTGQQQSATAKAKRVTPKKKAPAKQALKQKSSEE